MIIGVVKRILKEDLSKGDKPPGWLDSLLAPLNQFIETIALALLNNLTFKDNFSGKEVEITLTDSTELSINPGSGRPRGVLLLAANGAIVTGFGWTLKTNGNVGVTVKFLTAGQSNSCLLQFLY